MNSKQNRILIVDDQTVNLMLLRAMLAEKGYRVTMAANGELALKMIAESPPDLILLDIMMPVMNGYEVGKHLKENPATQDIPIIFVSVLDDVEDKVKAFAVGGVDYVTKPFRPEEVLARVETHIALRQVRRQVAAQNKVLQQQIERRKQAETALKKSIDTRKGIEQDLQASQQFLNSLLDAMLTCVVIIDTQGKVIAFNRRWVHFAKLYGFASHNGLRGEDYWAMCEAASYSDETGRELMCAGLVKVLNGAQEAFALVHAWDNGGASHWYKSWVRAFSVGGNHYIMVTHNEVSAQESPIELTAEMQAAYDMAM